MQRILVGGISGAGKTTLARRLADRLDLPYVEMDGLHHGPGWVKRPEFEADVDTFTARPRWVTDSMGYASVRELCWARADTFVWLDYGRRVVMPRVIRRSAIRAVTRRELWNGNREDLRTWLRADHPIRWAWSQHARKREQVHELLADPRFGQVRLVQLTSPRAAAVWLRSL